MSRLGLAPKSLQHCSSDGTTAALWAWLKCRKWQPQSQAVMKETGLSPCLTAAFLHGNKSVSYGLLQPPICKKKGWFSSVSQRWAKHLKSLMSVKCIHFLRWKLLLMCEVLLRLLLLINKEGRAILFLGRLTQGTRMQRPGKMLICTKGDPLASAKLKSSICKTQR